MASRAVWAKPAANGRGGRVWVREEWRGRASGSIDGCDRKNVAEKLPKGVGTAEDPYRIRTSAAAIPLPIESKRSQDAGEKKRGRNDAERPHRAAQPVGFAKRVADSDIKRVRKRQTD